MDNLINEFFNSNLKIKQFCKENNLDAKIFSDFISKLGYIVSTKQSGKTIYEIKYAIEEYKTSKLTYSQIANKHNISSLTFKTVLKNLGILEDRIIKKYNEHVFDSIDTEEKAYWLGFIFADGYIYSLKPRKTNGRLDYNFELCSKGDDIEHMLKFAKFIEYESPLKLTDADKKGNKRCRVCLSNRHFWETLNNYGCTPRKSLTLEFPDESIFKDKSLIRHFIRGYFDGDGCISYANKEHTCISVSLLGTENFLKKVLEISNFTCNLQHNHGNIEESTMVMSLASRKGFGFALFLYKDCTIYLKRKFDRYCYFCRLYEKSDRLLETKIMEGCDANHEVSSEIKESEPLQRIETEPVKTE